MKQKQLRTIQILILIMLIIPVLSMGSVEQVVAVEAEEEDNFTTMPNYRWFNETTTSAEVTEQLEGDLYVVDSTNNATTGTVDFEKSRSLNSRDFYFESRFQMDIGGNQTEYFRDVVGDACDFEEGDDEGFVGEVFTVANGLLSTTGATTLNFRFVLPAPINLRVFDPSILEIKIKSTSVEGVYVRDIDNGDTKIGDTIENEWVIIEADYPLTGFPQWDSISWLEFYITPNSDGQTVSCDYMKFSSNLDYATHVESEVEDTWDWEDSNEFFYNTHNNISDFNDLSLENFTYSSTLESNPSGWLVDITSVSGAWWNCSNLINADTYTHLSMEINPILGSITQIDYYDGDDNFIGQDTTTYSTDNFYLTNQDFGANANWTGTETGFKIFWTGTSPTGWQTNFTFLYDTELGDIENVGYTFDRDYVNPNGYYVTTFPAVAIDHIGWTGLTVDSNLFEIFKFRMQTYSDIYYKIKGRPVGTGDLDLSSYILITTNSFVEYEVDLSLDSDWDGRDFDRLYITFTDDSGNFEGDELVLVDYCLLLGHWSETDGFKYSILNQNHEEGMYLQFTNPNATVGEYNLAIDMLDPTGVVLSYNQLFNYTTSDGWLHLDVEWHIDKKKIKVLFEYENGTDILKTRSMYDLYGSTGRERFVVSEAGFPRLCLNNTIGAMAHSNVVIDYIDADWRLIDWQEPTGEYDPIMAEASYVWSNEHSKTDNFSSISPYGFHVNKLDGSNISHYYQLSITRFDGVAFNTLVDIDNLDGLDYVAFIFDLWNVQTNGTLYPVFGTALQYYEPSEPGFDIWTGVDDNSFTERWTDTTIEGQFSMFTNADNTEATFQAEVESNSDPRRRTVTRRFNFTDEWVLNFAYGYNTTDGGAGDDVINVIVSGFEIARKDWIVDIVTAVLSPLLAAAMLLFSPFILLFNGLMLVVIKGLSFLADALATVFTAAIAGLSVSLGAAIGGIASGVWDLFSVIIGQIKDAIVAVAGGIWSLFETIIGQIKDAVVAMAGDIWDAFSSILGELKDGLLAIIGDFFDTLWEAADALGALFEAVIIVMMSGLSAILDAFIAEMLNYWEDIINNLLIPIFEQIIADLGLTEFFDFIGGWVVGVVAIIQDLVTLAGVVWGWVWANMIFWLEPSRFTALNLSLTALILFWVFYPLLLLLADLVHGEVNLDDSIDYLEIIVDHFLAVFKAIVSILTYMVELILRVINTIANFIPFT